jgi:hypothetical protein
MPVVSNDQVALSQISTENSQGEMPINKISEHSCRCNSTIQDDVNSVRLSESSNTVNHGSLAIGNSLNELTLPSFEDHSTQVVGTFLRELDLYFELKGIPETLKLPLVSKAIQDPFTKAWLSAEYYKIGNYQQFKKQVVQLLWNDQKQSNLRCKIFQDKFDRNGGETMAAHYLRYVQLAANLHPPLSEYDLLGAITAHFPYDVQKCMVSANLNSTQDALNLLGKLHAMEEENNVRGEISRNQRPGEFRRRDNRQGENLSPEVNRREYHNVRHVTYGQRHGNQRQTTYNRNTVRDSNRDRSNRIEREPTRERVLNPNVPEFAPPDSNHGPEPNATVTERARSETTCRGNWSRDASAGNRRS